MNHSLRLTGASRRLGGRAVLHGIDLALPAGAFLVLAGESGSGKTTMLRMIAGLDRADTGTVEINGRMVDDAARVFVPAERRGLGMVFQDFALWPHLSCQENVALALPAATPKRAEAALALLARMGVAAMAGRRPAELSGGQQQRVGIARALAAKPSLLLLDEPLSALDLETRERLREELRESLRAAGVGAVLVSHDPEDCWKLADQVAVLEQGVIRQAGTPQALWEAPASPYIARFTGAHGGISVPVANGAVLLGGQPLRHPGATLRGPRARLFWRDDAIRPAAQGIPAEAMDLRFEAGRFCVRWRIAGLTQPLSGYTAAPVPLGAHHLAIDPARIFLFDDSGDN